MWGKRKALQRDKERAWKVEPGGGNKELPVEKTLLNLPGSRGPG